MCTCTWWLRNYAYIGFYISVQRLCLHISAFVQSRAFRCSTAGFMHLQVSMMMLSSFTERKQPGKRTTLATVNEEGECVWVRVYTGTIRNNCLLGGSSATLRVAYNSLLLLPAELFHQHKQFMTEWDKTKEKVTFLKIAMQLLRNVQMNYRYLLTSPIPDLMFLIPKAVMLSFTLPKTFTEMYF